MAHAAGHILGPRKWLVQGRLCCAHELGSWCDGDCGWWVRRIHERETDFLCVGARSVLYSFVNSIGEYLDIEHK